MDEPMTGVHLTDGPSTGVATPLLTDRERRDLMRLVQERARIAKGLVRLRADELREDFEEQLATEYRWDEDPTWTEVYAAAQEASRRANEAVQERCEALGIPEWARPTIHAPYWSPRREGVTATRRGELRRVAHSRITALARDAEVRVARAALEAREHLIADALTSPAARAYLEGLPQVTHLMPPLVLAEVRALVRDGRHK
jgi:hypothetical protein